MIQNKNSVVTLLITNKTSDDRIVKLFNCNDLFHTSCDNDIEIENIFSGTSYKELLCLLLSSDNKMEFNDIIMLDTLMEDTLLKYYFKGLYGETAISFIKLYKHKEQQQQTMIGTDEKNLSVTIKNGCYIEYTAKANTKVEIIFRNIIETSITNVK